MKRKVLITCPNLLNTIERYEDIFRQNNLEITAPKLSQQLSESELIAIIDQFDGIIAGDDPFTERVLGHASRLKIIAKWGIGQDGIDLDAAKRLGIKVINTPGVFSNEVADVAIGYMIMLARKLHEIDRQVRSGTWYKPLGTSLQGKVLGIVGVGNIGKAVARRGAAMEMQLLGYDAYPIDPLSLAQTGMKQVSLAQILSEADFLVLSCNLTTENYHILDKEAFATMKPGVNIINVARGPLIDEKALIDALAERKVSGAALDVFETEPLTLDQPLHRFDSCIFGSHNGSNALEAVLRVNDLAIQNLLAGLEA